ncbi:hypothetical protein FPOAC2_11416 [Fusarium poae]
MPQFGSLGRSTNQPLFDVSNSCTCNANSTGMLNSSNLALACEAHQQARDNPDCIASTRYIIFNCFDLSRQFNQCHLTLIEMELSIEDIRHRGPEHGATDI